jgi:hypothetical protein
MNGRRAIRRKGQGAEHGNGLAGVPAAVELVKAACGVGAAKAALRTINQRGSG